MAHIFGSGLNSRLYRALVIDSAVASDAGAWYQGTMLDQTRFGISARPRDGVTLPQLEQAIDKVIADFTTSEIADDELNRAKTKLVADAVYAQDSQSSLARWYGAALTTGSTVEAVQARPERLRAVTAEQVRDAARRYLDKRRSVTGYLIRDAREEKKS
jgi:zinc protease